VKAVFGPFNFSHEKTGPFSRRPPFLLPSPEVDNQNLRMSFSRHFVVFFLPRALILTSSICDAPTPVDDLLAAQRPLNGPPAAYPE